MAFFFPGQDPVEPGQRKEATDRREKRGHLRLPYPKRHAVQPYSNVDVNRRGCARPLSTGSHRRVLLPIGLTMEAVLT